MDGERSGAPVGPTLELEVRGESGLERGRFVRIRGVYDGSCADHGLKSHLPRVTLCDGVDRKETEAAPDFRVVTGTTEIGAAWRRYKQGSEETYLRVKLDDPSLPQPIWGALLEPSEDGVARLLWRRDRREEG